MSSINSKKMMSKKRMSWRKMRMNLLLNYSHSRHLRVRYYDQEKFRRGETSLTMISNLGKSNIKLKLKYRNEQKGKRKKRQLKRKGKKNLKSIKETIQFYE